MNTTCRKLEICELGQSRAEDSDEKFYNATSASWNLDPRQVEQFRALNLTGHLIESTGTYSRRRVTYHVSA